MSARTTASSTTLARLRARYTLPSFALSCALIACGTSRSDTSDTSARATDADAASAPSAPSAPSESTAHSSLARAFMLARAPTPRLVGGRLRLVAGAPSAAIAAGSLVALEPSGPGALLARTSALPAGVRSSLAVSVPAAASGALALRHARGLAADVRLLGARSAAPQLDGDTIVYRGASPFGTDVALRVTHDGVEDFVVVDAPSQRALDYEVTLGADVAGVRFVAQTLELLDAGGAPRIRMAAPYVVDATGVRHAASVEVTGCTADRNPAPPWGRTVRAPESATCRVRVAWPTAGLPLPLLVDPAWTSTAVMHELRGDHSLVAIPGTSLVLAAGGYLASSTTYLLESSKTAELFDASTRTWAATASMAQGHADAVAGAVGGDVLIAGGVAHADASFFVTAIAAAERYSPTSGTWSSAGSMSQPRYLASGATVNPSATGAVASDRFVVAGGAGSDTYGGTAGVTSAVDVYQNGTGWLAPLTYPSSHLCYLSALVANVGQGLALVAGCGPSETSTAVFSATTSPPVIVDAIGSPVMKTAHAMGVAVSFLPSAPHAAASAVVVAGGQDASGALNAATEYFDVATSTWKSLPPLHLARLMRTSAPTAIPLAGGGLGAFLPMGDENNDGSTAKSTIAEIGRLPAGAAPAVWSVTDSGWASASAMSVTLADGSVLVAGPGRNAAKPGCVTTDCAFALIFSPEAGASNCTGDGDCASAHCVDGVCCDTACTGGCVACAPAKKADTDPAHSGVCGPKPVGSDALGACAATDACGNDGKCDGAGGCRLAAAGAPCGVTTCSGGHVSGALCNGSGTCNATDAGCTPYTGCDATGKACATSCGAQSECQPTHFCDSVGAAPTYKCLPKIAKGGTCASDVQCATSHCADGVCCDTACNGTCEACDGAAKGTCAAVSGAPHAGRPSCGGVGVCAGSCDGKSPDCKYNSSTVCASRCSAGQQTDSTCDGKGACVEGTATPCGGFACDPTGTCKQTCQTAVDCATGYECSANNCAPTHAKCTPDRSASIDPAGVSHACLEVLCDVPSGVCLQVCSSNDDCPQGLSCGSAQHCVKSEVSTTGSGGCAATGRSASFGAWAILFACACVGARRRSRGSARDAG